MSRLSRILRSAFFLAIITLGLSCDRLMPSGLTRNEAQVLLDRKIPTPTPAEAAITLNIPYSQVNYDYPPETPGALRIKQAGDAWLPPFESIERSVVEQAVQAGLIVQERGELADHVIMGMSMPPNLRPSFTNRLTEKGQRFIPGGRIIIPVTRTIEVTGISMDEGGKTATVTYSVTYNAVPFAGDIALTNLILHASTSPARGVPKANEANLQKFDDGWRVR